MRIAKHMQTTMALLLTCALALVLSGFDGSQKHQSPQEQNEGYYWYEAIFLDKEEVVSIFRHGIGRLSKV